MFPARFQTSSAEWYRRARFFLVTLAAYLLYIAVYWLLRHELSWPQWLMIILATLSGDVLNYMGNRFWVFRARTDGVMTQGVRFFAVTVFTLLVQALVFWVGMKVRFLPEAVLLLILPFGRMVLNYFFHAQFTFRGKRAT